MHLHKFNFVISLIFLASCLTCTLARAQNYPPPQGEPGQYDDRGYRDHRQGGDDGRRHDGGERHGDEQRDHRWDEHQQRFFGGIVIQADPYRHQKEYRRQLHAQCNRVWQSCAANCNAFPDAPRRAFCISNCNNYLYECNSMR